MLTSATIVIVHDVRKAQSWSAGGRGTTLGTIIFVSYLSALFMASIKDLEKALSATAVARQGRIYRETLYGDFCKYES